jgi:hypothetical protein
VVAVLQPGVAKEPNPGAEAQGNGSSKISKPRRARHANRSFDLTRTIPQSRQGRSIIARYVSEARLRAEE